MMRVRKSQWLKPQAFFWLRLNGGWRINALQGATLVSAKTEQSVDFEGQRVAEEYLQLLALSYPSLQGLIERNILCFTSAAVAILTNLGS